MKLGISEILDKIDIAPNEEAAIKIIQENDGPPLQIFFQLAFEPKFEWLLPEGDPPYKPCEYLDQHGMFFQALAKITIYLKGFEYDNITPLKRESLFIGLLESLVPADAVYLLKAKNKSLDVKYITAAFVEKLYPGLLSEVVEPVKEKKIETEEELLAKIPKSKLDRPRKSKYPNVYWKAQNKCWMAKVFRNRKQIQLGEFQKEVEAHKAVVAYEKQEQEKKLKESVN